MSANSFFPSHLRVLRENQSLFSLGHTQVGLCWPPLQPSTNRRIDSEALSLSFPHTVRTTIQLRCRALTRHGPRVDCFTLVTPSFGLVPKLLSQQTLENIGWPVFHQSDPALIKSGTESNTGYTVTRYSGARMRPEGDLGPDAKSQPSI